MKLYRILYFGSWGYGKAGLEALVKCQNVKIIRVYTKKDSISKNPYCNMVYDLAIKNLLPVIDSNKNLMKKEEFESNVIGQGEIDFIISCCYERIFSSKILDLPKITSINVHPSILPKYRGVKPLENAIANGEKVTGITIHEITQGIDEGDIILQYAKIPIKCFDTYSVLYERQCHAIKNILTRFFKKPKYFIRHKVEQNHSLATYAPRINFQIADEDTAQEIRQTALQNTF